MGIEKLKGQEGITIISVVAVIIVLLVLAGIAISQMTSTSSILETTKTATLAYNEETMKEKINIKITNLNVEKLGVATLDDLLELKNTDSDIVDAYRSGDNVILVMDNYQFEIDKNLIVKSITEYKESVKPKIKQVKRKTTYCTFDRGE